MVSPILHVPTFHNGRSATSKVEVSPVALLELIEAIYYDNTLSNTKIVGTLLGSRSDDGSIVHVKGSYIVPLKEENDELSFQDVYNHSTFQLYKKSNPDLTIVGWFSTNPKIDTYTGLVHDIYSKTNPNSIFLTLEYKTTEGEIVSPIIKTFTTSSVGLPITSNLVQTLGLDKSGAYAFIPVPNDVVPTRSEMSSLELIAKGAKNGGSPVSPGAELEQIQASVAKSIEMVKTLKAYVGRVQNGEIPGDSKVAEILLSTLRYKLGEDQLQRVSQIIENRQNESVVLEYLTSCLKQQLELSSKLTNFVLPEEALNL